MTLSIFGVANAARAKSYGLRFGPECDDYVTIPPSPDFNFSGPFTVECWFTVHGPHVNDHIPIVSKLPASADTPTGWALKIVEPFSEQLANSVRGHVGYDFILNASFSPKSDEWYHLAMSYDGRFGRLFLNGQMLDVRESAPGAPSNEEPLTIGGQNGSFWNRNLNGMIDEVRISDICRYTENFVPLDYFDNSPNTIALWHFDEGRGDTVYDEGPCLHHGIIHGAQWVLLSDDENRHFPHLKSPISAQAKILLLAFIPMLLLMSFLAVVFWRRSHMVAPAVNQAGGEKASSWIFLAQRMAHQIKTPLSTILMSLERIQQEYHKKLTPEESGRADVYVEGATKEIHRLIDSSRAFLQFLKIEAPSFSVIEIAAFLEQFLQLYRQRISDSIALKTDFQSNLYVKMDSTLMNVALENLLDNALKAVAGEGIIRLAAYGAEEMSPEGRQVNEKAIIEIEDSGRGMSPDLIERVFQAYNSSTAEGTGLGLFIVRRIVEDHQGRISIKSREGVGTKVTMEFSTVSVGETHGRDI